MPLADTRWTITAEQERPDGHGNYGRKSQNRDKKSQSVPVQLQESNEFNELKNWQPNPSLVFSDDNIPASEYSTKDRPGFEQMCDAIREGRMWTLTVTEVSRITRAMPVAVDFVKLAQQVGGLIIYTTEGKQFDLTTTTGVHDFYQAVVDASRESGKTSDRVKRNKEDVAKEGRYHGGRIPYGRMPAIKDKFDRVTNTGEAGHDIEPHQAAIVQETVQLIDEGQPFLSIHRMLTERGEVLPSPANFRRAISSPHVYGARSWRGRIVNTEAYPPIVEHDQWARAMAKLNVESRMKGADKKGKRSYVLTGWAYCACGEKMVAKGRDNHKGVPTRAYMCPKCYTRRIAEPVELLVMDAVVYRYSSPRFVEALRTASQNNGKQQDLSKLIGEVHRLQARLGELEDAWTNGTEGLDLNTMLRMKASMENELKSVNVRIDGLAATSLLGAALSGDIHKAIAKADLSQCRMFVGLIVDKVVISPSEPNAPRVRWTHEPTGKTFLFNPNLIKIDFKY